MDHPLACLRSRVALLLGESPGHLHRGTAARWCPFDRGSQMVTGLGQTRRWMDEDQDQDDDDDDDDDD